MKQMVKAVCEKFPASGLMDRKEFLKGKIKVGFLLAIYIYYQINVRSE